MTLLKYKEAEKAVSLQKATERIDKAESAHALARKQFTDIRTAGWYLDCGFTKFSTFITQNVKKTSDAQAYKQANAGALEYWLEGRSAVGGSSAASLEEVAKIKNEDQQLEVWKNIRQSGQEPTATLVKETYEKLLSNTESHARDLAAIVQLIISSFKSLGCKDKADVLDVLEELAND